MQKVREAAIELKEKLSYSSKVKRSLKTWREWTESYNVSSTTTIQRLGHTTKKSTTRRNYQNKCSSGLVWITTGNPTYIC